jgi:pre-mRNA-processing factor 19
MLCVISGSVPQDPVVSSKTGHLYERSVIEKCLENDGKCPVTGTDLSHEDLIAVKASKDVQPKSISTSNIPALLSALQTEWDEAVLETFSLRQSLDNARQELSQALYQHDAACRVIARLMRERDEACDQLSMVGLASPVPLATAASNTSKHGETTQPMEESGPDGAWVDAVEARKEDLSSMRKQRQKSTALASPEDLAALTQVSSATPHSSKPAGITCADLRGSLVVSGGNDKAVIISSLEEGSNVKIVQKLTGHKKKVVSVAFLGGETESSDGIVSGSADGTLRIWGQSDSSSSSSSSSRGSSSGGYTEVNCINLGNAIAAVAPHPLSSYVAATCGDAWSLFDCAVDREDALVTMLTGTDLGELAFHPDGLLLAAASAEQINVWDIRNSTESVATFELAGVNQLTFSENGYHLVAAAGNSVDLFDLRKLKCTGSLSVGAAAGAPVSAISIDSSGSYLGMGFANGNIALATMKPLKLLMGLPSTLSHSKSVSALHFGGNDARVIMSASLDRSIRIFK